MMPDGHRAQGLVSAFTLSRGFSHLPRTTVPNVFFYHAQVQIANRILDSVCYGRENVRHKVQTEQYR